MVCGTAPAVLEGPRPAVASVPRVLVVDDNQDLADSLSALLTLRGYETRAAYDGQQAVEVAAQFGPDMVVLDLNMPIMDGYAAAKQLRSVHGPDLLLLAMTGAPEWETRDMAAAGGFDMHLGKPVDADDLLEALARLRR
ncbi:response regulator [Aquabacterium sp. A7-Y]|nr:response regulator [Aquabacterium sp. A7-Y]MCW7540124.1 response regulator [Aquabacterium sp. A7-Y]